MFKYDFNACTWFANACIPCGVIRQTVWGTLPLYPFFTFIYFAFSNLSICTLMLPDVAFVVFFMGRGGGNRYLPLLNFKYKPGTISVNTAVTATHSNSFTP